MTFLKTCVATLVGISVLRAEPPVLSGAELLKACQTQEVAQQNFCYGYIIAASNAAQYYRNIVDARKTYLDICFPQDLNNADLVSLFLAEAPQQKEFLTQPAFVVVSSILSTAYSCKNE